MPKKSLDITQDQEEWLEEKSINFAKFVRKKIDEEMRGKQ